MPNDGGNYKENEAVFLGESNPKLRKNLSAAVREKDFTSGGFVCNPDFLRIVDNPLIDCNLYIIIIILLDVDHLIFHA